ncbi:MAG: hypothetical protein BWY89_02042 [Bacteroidetes bacterium ADurb.BinA012]|nr:MAG: hypothetical protein BWY89_02042 [Bacteroidetes bacterium ADurb.BinA012]
MNPVEMRSEISIFLINPWRMRNNPYPNSLRLMV